VSNDAIMLNPDALTAALKIAERLAKSNLIPKPLQGKPDDVLVVLLTGRSYGVDPMTALSNISVINGKPVLEAKLLHGLCLARRDVCEYFVCVDATATSATYEAKRVGAPKPERKTWTLKQAQDAGLTGKENWSKYPQAMLEARAKAALARSAFPDVVTGAYIPDEAEEMDGRRGFDPEEAFRDARPPIQGTARALPAESATAQATPRLETPRAMDGATVPAATMQAVASDVPPAGREPGADDGDEDPMAKEYNALISAIANAATPAEVGALKPRIKAFSGEEYKALIGIGTKRVETLKAQQATE
jgi:hypothetical protein